MVSVNKTLIEELKNIRSTKIFDNLLFYNRSYITTAYMKYKFSDGADIFMFSEIYNWRYYF